jgi:hypothetical protein
MANEILQKSRARFPAQANTNELVVDQDPNGTYAGATPTVISNTYAASENAKGAEVLQLELDVTTHAGGVAGAQIWYSISEIAVDSGFTKWKYSHTLGEDIESAEVDLYDAGIFQLIAKYTKLAVVAKLVVFNATLYATPKLMEAQ